MTQFFFTAYLVLPQFCAGRVIVYRQSLIRSRAAARPIARRLWNTIFRQLYHIISEQPSFFNAELKYFPLILSPNKKSKIFPAEFVPYCVAFLDHISPLCSAEGALSGANSARKSNCTFYQGIVLQYSKRSFTCQAGIKIAPIKNKNRPDQV
jgi:hypothetical protein